MKEYLKYSVGQILPLDKQNLSPTTDAWVCIVNENNHIFVQYFPDWSAYGMPGGFLQGNETPEDAAMRGFKEMTGAEVSLTEENRTAYVTYTHPDFGTGYSIFFITHEWKGDLNESGKWLANVDAYDVSNVVRPLLYAIKLNTQFPIMYNVDLFR